MVRECGDYGRVAGGRAEKTPLRTQRGRVINGRIARDKIFIF